MQGSIPGNSVEQSIGYYRTEIRHGSGLDTSARNTDVWCPHRFSSSTIGCAVQCETGGSLISCTFATLNDLSKCREAVLTLW